MAKNTTSRRRNGIYALHAILTFVLWISAILVSLSVGLSMTKGGVLYNSIPYIPGQLTSIGGWIIIVLTVLSTILAIIESLSRD